MNLSKVLGIKNDTIAVIGMGGKTTLCYQLARENADKKTILTTTTKMMRFCHEDISKECDFYDFTQKDMPCNLSKGVNVFGKIKSFKITSLENDELLKLHQMCDCFIYEADGSKYKPIKMWNENEPVILPFTSKVIGTLPLFVLGKKIDNENVFRLELFCETFGVKIGDTISEELILKVIEKMFDGITWEKILILNRFEKKYIDFVMKIAKTCDFKVFYGSIKNGEIKPCHQKF